MSTSAGDALVRRWVGRRAGEELERLRREEMPTIDTREAVRQIFGSAVPAIPAPPTSGLVEQQAWLAKISPGAGELRLPDTLKHVARA
jgi:hypothetical protein